MPLPTRHLLLSVKSRLVYLSRASLPRLSWEKRPINGCSRSSSSCSGRELYQDKRHRFFQEPMSFLLPNQQRQSIKGKEHKPLMTPTRGLGSPFLHPSPDFWGKGCCTVYVGSPILWNKDHEWDQECRWRCQGCMCHESQLYIAKSDGIDARAAARPSSHIYTAALYSLQFMGWPQRQLAYPSAGVTWHWQIGV